MMVGEQEFINRANRVRALSEPEKVALICSQHYHLNQVQQRVEQLKCAHEKGECVLCKDKDKTIEELNDTIKALRAKLYGKSSEKSKPGGNGKGGKPGNSGPRTRLPSDQYPNAKIVNQDIKDPQPPKCPECKQDMTDSGLRETSERLELIPMEIYILRLHRVRYHCKCCQTAPETAALPDRIAPSTSLSDSVLIEASIAKFYDLIPAERFAKMLRRSSVDISDDLVRAAQTYFARAVETVYGKIKMEVLASRVTLVDETPHRMLERNEGNYSWYLWAFCTRVSVYFEIHSTRAGTVSIEFLKESRAAYLVSDAYSGYTRTVNEVNEYRESKGIPLLIPANCNDHGRRYFFYAKDHELGQRGLEIYDKIYAIEAQVQDLIEHPKYEGQQNQDEALKLRQTADLLFNEIYNVSCEILLDNSSDTAVGKAANYFLNNLKGLTVYLTDLDVPISNAHAERSIRNPVLGRKTWFGTHSKKGADVSAILFSIFESCKLNGLNPREYCNYLAGLIHKEASLPTPFEYKKVKTKPPPS